MLIRYINKEHTLYKASTSLKGVHDANRNLYCLSYFFTYSFLSLSILTGTEILKAVCLKRVHGSKLQRPMAFRNGTLKLGTDSAPQKKVPPWYNTFQKGARTRHLRAPNLNCARPLPDGASNATPARPRVLGSRHGGAAAGEGTKRRRSPAPALEQRRRQARQGGCFSAFLFREHTGWQRSKKRRQRAPQPTLAATSTTKSARAHSALARPVWRAHVATSLLLARLDSRTAAVA